MNRALAGVLVVVAVAWAAWVSWELIGGRRSPAITEAELLDATATSTARVLAEMRAAQAELIQEIRENR